jgi:hypothetical protein
MDDLLTLIERYAPGYRARIRGAAWWWIDDLEANLGRPLPAAYREFVEAMGADGGPLLAGLRNYQTNKIAELYKDLAFMPPRRFLFVFGDDTPDAPEHFFLDLERPTDDGADAEVVRFPLDDDGSARTHRFVSLRELLFVLAMRNIALPGFPWRAEYLDEPRHGPEREPTGAEAFAALFGKLGFRRLAFPRRCALFERDDAVIELYNLPDRPGCSFRVGFREQGELRRLAELLADHTTAAPLR